MGATAVILQLKFNFPGQLVRSNGWSESYALGYADLPTALAGSANLDAFIRDRCYCLGIGPYLYSAILSGYVQPLLPGAVPVRRSSLSYPLPLPIPASGQAYNKAFNGGTFPLTYEADYSTTVFYIRLQTSLSGTPVYSRNCWIAGLPDIADATNVGTINESQTLTAFQKFIGDLGNQVTSNGGKNSVSIRSIDRSGANTVKLCTAWNLGANTYTVPAHGFAANQPIMAEGMKTEVGGQCPRGRYLVNGFIDANTIALQDSETPTAPTKFGGFRAAITVFNSVSVASPIGFTKRDKGRPFGQSVGRRKTALIRRA